MNTVRHLKDIGVEVRFEKEHIHSLSGDGELMMTILASYAQEESRSISENVKWGVCKMFEDGRQNGFTRIYGYSWDGFGRYWRTNAMQGICSFRSITSKTTFPIKK